MFGELVVAIVERLKQGQSEASIRAEVVAAGHPETTFEAALAAAKHQLAPATGPEESSSAPAGVAPSLELETPRAETLPTAEAGAPPSPPASLSAPAPSSRVVPIALATLLLLSLIGVAYAAFSFGVFGNRPYQNGGEITLGLIKSMATDDPINFALAGETVLMPVENLSNPRRVPEIDELVSLYTGFGIEMPREGRFAFELSGTVMVDDVTEPDFDMTLAGEVMLEPIAADGSVQYRRIDGNVYVNLTNLPTVLQSSAAGIPVGEWIEMGDMRTPIELPELPALPGLSAYLPQGMNERGATAHNWLSLLGSVGVVSPQLSASLVSALTEQNFDDEDRAAFVELVKATPPLRLVGEPIKVERNETTVYRYEVDVDYDGVVAVIDFFGSYLTAAQRRELSWPRPSDLPPRALVEHISDLTTVNLYATPNGTFVAYEVTSAIFLGETTTGVQFTATFDWSAAPGATIVVPEQVFTKTFSELKAEDQARRRVEFEKRYDALYEEQSDQEIKSMLYSVRYVAESYYSETDSYGEFCQTEEYNDTVSGLIGVTCNDSAFAYVISAPLTNPDVLYCLDSTGVVAEIPKEEIGLFDCGQN